MTLDKKTLNRHISTATDSSDEDFHMLSHPERPMPQKSRKNSLESRRSSADNILMDPKLFVPKEQWIEKSDRNNCFVCERSFSVFFLRRHTCRMCGEVICRKCSLHKKVDLPIAENKVRVCTSCQLNYRSQQQNIQSIAAVSIISRSPISPVSSTSSADNQKDAEDAKSVSAALRAAMAATETARREEGARKAATIAKELAAQRALVLEKEVEESKKRVFELEAMIKVQDSCSKSVPVEQENQLRDAREMIKILQSKLSAQEKVARGEKQALSVEEESLSSDDLAFKLKKKLEKMERQLQQAGINVVEDIPYEEAKQKVSEISKRMQEIGKADVDLEDKAEQMRQRKEYFQLEQDMERYNTALMMTDEYIAAEKLREETWNQENLNDNKSALSIIRQCIPVNISNLSQKSLIEMETPSSKSFSRNLACKLKRSNILEILRVDPKNIVRMHPSVIEKYSLTGLTLLERRALHMVLYNPFLEWKKQKNDELSFRKYQWYKNLNDTLVSLVAAYNKHVEAYGEGVNHSCDKIGRNCPVRVEALTLEMYSVNLGFSSGDEYFVREVLKSDAEGAGGKALAEAQAHAKAMAADQREKELKKHYGKNVREIALACGAMDDMDSFKAEIIDLETGWVEACVSSNRPNSSVPWENELSGYLTAIQTTKKYVLLMANRASMNLSGKRDPSKDKPDKRSPSEIMLSEDILALISSILADMSVRLSIFGEDGEHRGISKGMANIQGIIKEVGVKNKATYTEIEKIAYVAVCKRLPWNEQVQKASLKPKGEVKSSEVPQEKSESNPPKPPPGANMLFAAIQARKSNNTNDNAAPNSMLAAIKARKKNHHSSMPNVLAGASGSNPLLEAIRKRSNPVNNPN